MLDVGPGHGKAGILLREYAGVERVDAVEAWPAYRTPRLHALYDTVFACDVLDLPPLALRGYELVLMVEVLEHLEKADGLALIDRIPGWIVICTPAAFFQNPEADAIPPERHRSLWSATDFGDRLEHDASQLGGVLVRLRPKG